MKLSRSVVVILLIVSSIGSGCTTVKSVSFENYVDTTAKPIKLQAKKTFKLNNGDIYLSNAFNGARLNDVKQINDTLAEIYIQPENSPINNSPYYAFKAWSDLPTSFYLRFKYPKGYNHRYVPKLKINDKWKIADSTQLFTSKDAMTVKLSLTTEPILVSAQEIQSSVDVKNWYSALLKGKDFVHLNSYGTSVLGKNLPVLDIHKNGKDNKDLIILLTRQHPPEVTGYFAFQAFLETILKDSELSNTFLNTYRILAFPIMNPDGVDLGHWRHNANGVDLNRDWSRYNQPEIKQAVKYISKAIKKSKTRVILGLDFHSTWYDVFYTNESRAKTTMPQFIDNWFIALEHNIPDYTVNETSSDSDKPVSKGWFLYGHDAVGITYEIGDTTSKTEINRIGKVSATEMMKILLKK
ncbi:MAG: hypothetical protein HKN40_03715 [Winogradskyella sp.]|uniref:M14 family metallopeptidase n=1 Tax=Winogradskyella sp. TaxID=1883156 RepID=UPI001806025D|nr:hypothetical protein [Winogradskyella sp.]